MKITLFFFICFFNVIAFGQDNDVSGVWIGSSTFMKGHSQLKYDLKQSGEKVTGIVEAKSENSKDQITYSVEGTLKGKSLKLKPVKSLNQRGLACMSTSELNLSLYDGQSTLTGRWKGDAKLKTCPPLISGSITLVRKKIVEKVIAESSFEEKPIQSVSNEDAVGKALVSELSKRKFYALIIGINDYQDNGIQDLDNPINDATALSNVLVDHYSFERGDVEILQNPRREDIIESLDKLTGKVTEKDNLLIFYAGHGIWNEQLNQGYWLPSDASMNSKSYWLSNSTLRDYVGGINSKHTLLISDACFSGGILKERAVFDNSRAILEIYKLPSRKAMTSGTLKTVPDESVFIEYLLKNLRNNQAPLLSADQLFRHFKTAVINNSPNGQVPQYGPISQAGDEGGDFIFLRKQ